MVNESTPPISSHEDIAAQVRVPLIIEAAHGEIIEAAREFVASTSVFRQVRAVRPQFERLAVALLDLERRAAILEKGRTCTPESCAYSYFACPNGCKEEVVLDV